MEHGEEVHWRNRVLPPWQELEEAELTGLRYIRSHQPEKPCGPATRGARASVGQVQRHCVSGAVHVAEAVGRKLGLEPTARSLDSGCCWRSW